MPDPTPYETNQELRQHSPWFFKWAEDLGSGAGTARYQFSRDSSQASMTIFTEWDPFSIGDVQAEILGYSYRVNNLLSRRPPTKHPYFPWLYATTLTNIEGVKVTGRDTTTKGVTTRYLRAKMTIGYTTLPYNVLDDLQLLTLFDNKEWERNVIKLRKTNAEYISIDRGIFKFAEGTANNPNGLPFNLGTGRITTKSDIEWTWVDVPERYVFDANGVATNIEACIGKVNGSAIWGYPAGTLLMLPPDYTPVMQPVPPWKLGINNTYSPPRAWNIKLVFKHWDPPLGTGATVRGHNTAMYVYDALFYLIETAGGTRLFQNADFSTIFNAV